MCSAVPAVAGADILAPCPLLALVGGHRGGVGVDGGGFGGAAVPGVDGEPGPLVLVLRREASPGKLSSLDFRGQAATSTLVAFTLTRARRAGRPIWCRAVAVSSTWIGGSPSGKSASYSTSRSGRRIPPSIRRI